MTVDSPEGANLGLKRASASLAAVRKHDIPSPIADYAGGMLVDRLIDALGAGRAVILFGAGPSTEVGLPSWSELVRGVGDAASEVLGDLPSVQGDIAAGHLPKAMGDVERLLNRRQIDGRSFIITALNRMLADPGRHGQLYGLMAKLPVRLYMTTNFDSVFERHVRETGRAPSVYTNTRESLEELDPASYDKTILHLHGSLDRGGHLVMTDSDYSRARDSREFEPLRKTFESYLVNSPVVILGYGLSDPDLKSIAQRVARVIRRRRPVLALLADGSADQAEKFGSDYNIEVYPYNSHHDHAELRATLASVVKWLEEPQAAVAADPEGLRVAQALYVYDATQTAGTPAIHVALKSLVLSVLVEAPDGLTPDALLAALRERAGVNADPSRFDAAWRECERDGMLDSSRAILRLTDEGHRRVELSRRKYRRLWQNMADDAQMRVGGDQELGSTLEEVLFGLFSERAAEAVGLSIHGQPVATSSLSLFGLISQRSQSVLDQATRLRFIGYVIDLLRKPNSAQKAVIEHLGRNLFCTHALRMDADTHSVLKSFVSGKAVLLDSNVLIPVLAVRSPKHASMCSLLDTARENGVGLFTTSGFLLEAIKHASWAKSFIDEHPNDEAAVLAAARGFGVWDGNDFLNGLILSGNETGRRQSVYEYLRTCLGSVAPDVTALRSRVEKEWGIRHLAPEQVRSICDDYEDVLTSTEGYIRDRTAQRKSEMRVRTEAEAYTLVHQWPHLVKAEGFPAEVFVLSSGGYLNRVAAEGPHKVNRNVTITPYALAAFIGAYLNSSAIHDFATIVRSEFFSAASDFIEEDELERYFAGVIAAADRVYEEELRPRLQRLEAELIPEDLPDNLADVAPVERPQVVRGLVTFLAEYSDPAEVSQLRRDKQEAEKRAEAAEKKLKKREKGEARYKRQQQRKRPDR